MISATPELFSEDERVEFLTGIVEATGHPGSEESLSPDGAATGHSVGSSQEFVEDLRVCFI
jgi:hypothetical protein